MQGVSVSDIHGYPLRPPGFEEPLFSTETSRKEVAEHLLEAPWLSRASKLQGRAGETAHVSEEPVNLESLDGRVEVVRSRARRRCSRSKRRVVEVLDRWREVRRWWDRDNGVDRLLFRVLLSGGVIVDTALERSPERSGEWYLVGVVD